MSENENIKQLSHLYYEIGGELLSKPNALAQIIEGLAIPATVVFCNTPSDTDLVEVLLKKRGVAARKLIGNVPPQKVEKTMEQLKNGEISTIVITDIAAKGVDIDSFDMVVNYTAPSDADTYLARIQKDGDFKRLNKVVTLVAPLDITNFHYVRKVIEVEFKSESLPSPDQMYKAKIDRLAHLALQRHILHDEKIPPMIQAVLAHADKDAIIGMLLHNTFDFIPQLQVVAEREDNSGDDRRGGRRDDHRGDDRRRDRDGGRGQRRPYADLDDEELGAALEQGEKRKPRVFLPPLKEARMYIGSGSENGIDESALRSIVTGQTGIGGDDIRRVVVRGKYAFFDILNEKAEEHHDQLELLKDSGGKNLVVRKATVISTQRQEEAPAATDGALPAPGTQEEAAA